MNIEKLVSDVAACGHPACTAFEARETGDGYFITNAEAMVLASKLIKMGYEVYYGSDFTTLRDGDQPYYISMQSGDDGTGDNVTAIWFID